MSKRFTYYSSKNSFNPTDLNPELLFDPNFDCFSDLIGTPCTNNTTIREINNQGVGSTTKAAEAANKMTWKEGGVGTLGGLPYGVTALTTTANSYNFDVSQAITGEFEAFIVIETVTGTSISTNQTTFRADSKDRGYIRFDYGIDRVGLTEGLGAVFATQVFSDSTRYIINISRNSSDLVTIRVDGLSIGTGTHTPDETVMGLLGATDTVYNLYYTFFKITELSAADRTSVYNYLNTLYV